MSYLSFLRIQCSMGNEEDKIIHYIIFGKREELTQFPSADREVCLTGEDGTVKVRPIYLFWDKTDELFVSLYEKNRFAETLRFASAFKRGLSVMATKHIRNKYKEVFLSNAETLFLSERAQKEIPPEWWSAYPETQYRMQRSYACEKALQLLAKAEHGLAVFLVLEEECCYEQLQLWLCRLEGCAGANIKSLFLFGLPEQKESGEDVLETFYTETGLAGSFYTVAECKRILAATKDEVLLLDCRGLPVEEIGRPTFYIDGSGVRTEKEIRRFSGICKACDSLRNHLDRAFLSAL